MARRSGDRAARRPAPKRIARQRFSSISLAGSSSVFTPSSMSRAAWAMQATISPASASDSVAVVCASQIRTSTVPNARWGRTDHQTCVYSTIDRVLHQELDVLGESAPASERVRDPASREATGEDLAASAVQAGVAPVEERRARRDCQQRGQHRPQTIADQDRAVGASDADVNMHREGVVAPGDVLEAPPRRGGSVGVDDLLGAVVGHGCVPLAPSRTPSRGGEPEQPAAAFALSGQRVGEILAATGPDLDLRGDQLTGDRRRQDRIRRRRRVQSLETGRQLEIASRGSRTPPPVRR